MSFDVKPEKFFREFSVRRLMLQRQNQKLLRFSGRTIGLTRVMSDVVSLPRGFCRLPARASLRCSRLGRIRPHGHDRGGIVDIFFCRLDPYRFAERILRIAHRIGRCRFAGAPRCHIDILIGRQKRAVAVQCQTCLSPDAVKETRKSDQVERQIFYLTHDDCTPSVLPYPSFPACPLIAARPRAYHAP